MNKKLLMALDALIIMVLIILDQFTKHLAVVHLKDQPAIPIISNVLELDYLENHGIAFGMLPNQTVFILLIGVIFVGGLLFFLCKTPIGKKYTALHIILTFIIAGGIGNMIDRVMYHYVIDFISFVLIDFPIFNVADCYVVCGSIALAFVAIFVLKEEDLDFISFQKKKE